MRKFFFIVSGVLLLAVVSRVLLSFFFGPSLSDGQQVQFEATILAEPTEQYGQLTFPVSYTNIWGSKTIRITTGAPQLRYGQKILIIGKVNKRVLDSKRVVFAIYLPTIEVRQSIGEIPLAIASALRSRVQHVYEHMLGKDEASLLLGIVLGVKGTFSQELLAAFQSTGVMHVIAASGMNVTLVAGFLISIMGRYMKRQYVGSLTILALLLYCLLAGLQPSIVRATVMGGLGIVAQLWGRQYSGMYGLFLAASGMLLLNPTLIADVGFQLSFASSLGILGLHPHLSKLPFFSEDIVTTLSAQIATLPILLMTFGQYGVLSILVNALVLWTVAPLMIVGGVGAIIGLVFLPLGSIISLISLPLLWYFEKIVLFFGQQHWVLSVDTLPMVWVVGYYAIIIAVVLFLHQKNNEKILATT